MLWPTDKKTRAKRDEGIKAELIEAAVKNASLLEDPVAGPAAGLLALYCDTDAERDAMLAARPSIVLTIQKGLSSRTTSLVAALCQLLKVMAKSPDTRTKLLRAYKDWDWKPLLQACSLLVCSTPDCWAVNIHSCETRAPRHT